MNRADRRAARATWRQRADQVAAILARSVVDLGTRRHLHQDPVAIGALERGFAHVLRQLGEPHVMRLTDHEGAAFAPEVNVPSGWAWYLAVGIDRLGRGSYVSHPVKVEGTSAVEARRMIEAFLLSELKPVLEDTSPMPVPEGLA